VFIEVAGNYTRFRCCYCSPIVRRKTLVSPTVTLWGSLDRVFGQTFLYTFV